MYCTKCGGELGDNARFCHICGNEVYSTSSQESSKNIDGDLKLEETHNIDIKYTFQAFREIGRFWFSPIDTDVHLHENLFVVETNFHGKILKKEIREYQFYKSDIKSVKTTFVPIVLFIDIIRLLIGALLLFTGIYGVIAMALFVFIMLTRAVCIQLNNGEIIKIYYENPYEIKELLNKLQG